ncbi:hypothetical protein XJ32_04125 [Helicobacter bilis]|uniref:Toxin-antitoxin system YwqK family antitoxin n=1 Tax=Helicobacter bilis TaxID=37372 RepID=A0A1Q2LG70_9HELI|nr:toxin-antitoxin system YwqK family antitoxin [Helicobacter bilis]AQQ59413.1 hypothetical protein XJ32_04125 [Helicobacter bilis]
MLLKSVFIGFLSFSILHADTLKECKTEADKISGCIEKKYDSSVNIWIETPYKNGKVDGIAKEYYEKGKLASETPFKNDKREGIEKLYNENGNLVKEVPYKNREVNGTTKTYDDNGNLILEASVLNDILHGDMRFYTEDKKLLATINAQNDKFISGKCFNDKVLTDKALEEIYIFNNISKTINYLQRICLKSADTLKECESEADKISGCVERGYYANGNLWVEMPYKNGKREGIEKEYHYENGKLRAEIPFKNDSVNGDIKLYTKDGKLLALIKAENNKFISGKCSSDKALTSKDLEESNKYPYFESAINHLEVICIKSDSK